MVFASPNIKLYNQLNYRKVLCQVWCRSEVRFTVLGHCSTLLASRPALVCVIELLSYLRSPVLRENMKNNRTMHTFAYVHSAHVSTTFPLAPTHLGRGHLMHLSCVCVYVCIVCMVRVEYEVCIACVLCLANNQVVMRPSRRRQVAIVVMW